VEDRGLSELALKQYSKPRLICKRRLTCSELQNKGRATIDALARLTSFRKIRSALPLLVNATTRAGKQRTLNALLSWTVGVQDRESLGCRAYLQRRCQTQSKDSSSLFIWARLPDQNDLDAAIAALNRATVNDPRLARRGCS